ncbi:MAG: pirin family protein [Proteobacteria bacterium]|nr:pirin family protein [Pseudomonadota bacterium]
MIRIRKSNERGNTQIDWLNSFHTFSFAEYYDPDFMGFSTLRVINEDFIQPASGFGKHPHKNMEIITYIVQGSLEHQDSMGNGSIIKPGEIQRMSAGTRVEHSEFNHSKTELLHLLQIWILPEESGLQPGYEQKTIKKSDNQLILIGSRSGGDGAVTIHQDVNLYVAYLKQHHSIHYDLKHERQIWLQLIKGEIDLNTHQLSAGDGVAVTNENKIEIKSLKDAEFLMFDLG